MHSVGQHSTTANAGEQEQSARAETSLQANSHLEGHAVEGSVGNGFTAVTSTAANVIPTSPQYGVAIIPNLTGAVTAPTVTVAPTTFLPTETVTAPSDTVTDTTVKQPEEAKDLQATPSRNDRFKVVKIASLEPFKRGRWKCMDYVDEQPPQSGMSKVSQSTSNIQIGNTPTGGVYLQTQSMPQQQIQQYLMQGGYSNGIPYIQMQMPQSQYFYPQVTNMQTQTLQQQVPSSMPAQFINSAQPYFPPGVVPNPSFNVQSYPNVPYMATNMMQNQNSAFVPTSQTVQLPPNFQQSQSYSGQPNMNQPMVNGHSYPQNDQQVGSTNLPTQTAKNVILNSNMPPPQATNHGPIGQNQMPMPNSNPATQNVSVIQNQQYQPTATFQQPVQPQPLPNQNSNQQQVNSNQQQPPPQQPPPQQQQPPQQPPPQQPQPQQPPPQQQPNPQQHVPVGPPSTMTQVVQPQPHMIQTGQNVVHVQGQTFDQNLSSVYANQHFIMSGSTTSLTNLDNSNDAVPSEAAADPASATEPVSDSADDPSKTNPVVNAIDNKIEQAMDLVKSHLMYTVREEVEVLKEKISELMEKIQQLETENNFLKSQISKGAGSAPTSITSNPNPMVNQGPMVQTNVSNPSPNIIPNTQPNLLQNPAAHETAPTH